MYKVIVERKKNGLPDEKIEERLNALEPGWEILSVNTEVTAWGEMTDKDLMKQPLHIFTTVTIILKKADQ